MSKSWWGDPTYKPRDNDTVKFIDVIRKELDGMKDRRALEVAFAAMRAINCYINTRFGGRESMAILQSLRAETMGAP